MLPDIKVRFSKYDDEQSCWEEFGHVEYIHYQLGLIVHSPAYENQWIDEEVVVQVELVREINGETETSEPINFKYVPMPNANKKRLTRMKQQNHGMNSRSGEELDGPTHNEPIKILVKKMNKIVKLFKNSFEQNDLREMLMALVETQYETGLDLFSDCLSTEMNEDLRDLVSMLIKFRMDFAAKEVNELQQNCVHLSIIANRGDFLRALLELGADVNHADVSGKTPLHIAAAQSSEVLVKQLLDASSEIKLNQLNKKGLTPLHVAVKRNKLPTVKLLVQAGADTCLKTRAGDNILQIAMVTKYFNSDMIDYLTELDKSLVKELITSVNGSLRRPRPLQNKFTKNYRSKNENRVRKCVQAEESQTEKSEEKPCSTETKEAFFDHECLLELCKILDINRQWEKLTKLMDLEEKIDEFEKAASPSNSLFKHLEVSA